MFRLVGTFAVMSAISTNRIDKLMQSLAVLIVVDNQDGERLHQLVDAIGRDRAHGRKSPLARMSAPSLRH